jgi:5-methylcytosine-specific restriction endonuclease McrA
MSSSSKMGSRARHRARKFLRENGGDQCFYCGKHLEESEMTIDHFIPISHGGHPKSIENIVAACAKCNKAKKSKLLWDPNFFLTNTKNGDKMFL